jgi:hypothetical protein
MYMLHAEEWALYVAVPLGKPARLSLSNISAAPNFKCYISFVSVVYLNSKARKT